MAQSLPTEMQREVARVPRAMWNEPSGGERINRHIARSEGFTEAVSSVWDQGVYALFDEMEEKDAHLFSILQTRRNGVLGRPRAVEPASADPSDRIVANWVRGALERLPDWESALAHLLGALAQGMAVLEVMWGYDAQGRIIPTELKPRAPWRFQFGSDGELRLDDPALASGREKTGQSLDSNRSVRNLFRLRWTAQSSGASAPAPSTSPLPERKFLVLRFNASDERPYGRGLLERVYWYWWFKKNNLKFWVMYNEKFGAPTVVARHAPGLSQIERDRLLEVISSLQADAGVTVPEGITLELLESNRSGSADTYRDLANWCNEEMSRAVLGQTLTVSEGTRGSLAQARVHDAVRLDYVRADAQLLAQAINGQLLRWMIDLNYGEEFPAPRWTIDLTPEADDAADLQIDRQLLQMGVPLPLRYFYQRYARPVADGEERLLRYDDSNLFQYHLQFGVLTVNEVRASLGLAPVPWGDTPTSPVAAQSSPSAPHEATGDAPLEEQTREQANEKRREG